MSALHAARTERKRRRSHEKSLGLLRLRTPKAGTALPDANFATVGSRRGIKRPGRRRGRTGYGRKAPTLRKQGLKRDARSRFAERAPSRHSPGLESRRNEPAAECIPQSCPAGASRLQKACCRARARARWSRRRQFGPKVRSYSFFRGDDKKQTVDVRTEKR
jgi:hypothetical protein